MQNKQPETTPTPYVLSIDLGSGGPKAAIISDTGDVIASAAEKTTTHLLPRGGAEQDPDEWWNGAKKTARHAISASGVSPKDIIAVSCTSQWSVVVPVGEHGEPLMRAVHWLDTRGGPYNRTMIRGFPSIQGYGLFKLLKWIRLTGLAPTHSGVDSLGHILFIKNERPEIYAQTFKFLEPMDYLTLRLTGRFTASQHTMAPMLVADTRRWSRLDYSDELLKLAGVEKEKFPQLIPSDGFIGPLLPAVAKELGLRPTTQVLTGINDTNSSAIGAGAVGDFDGIIYIGTSLVMTCHLPFKKTDLFHLMTTMPSPIRSRYLLMAEQGTGGKSLEFYLKNIVYADDELGAAPMPDDAYERVNRIAAAVPAGSEGVLYLPWLNGTLAPEENATARGGFFNLSLSGPAEKLTGQKFSHFRFAGGGAQSDVWAQIHADVLGVPIHQLADPTHVTVRGAALLAFDRLGHRSLKESADLVKIRRVFEPDESKRAVYDKMYEQFRAVYKRNKKVFAALNTA
jgi:xylulokinase